MEQQIERNLHFLEADIPPDVIHNASKHEDWLNLHLYKDLTSLQDRNETLFYRLLMDQFKRLAPIIYTPTVGQACLSSHSIYRQPRGMYFSVADRGNFSAMTYNWPHDEVDVIVVTDGSRVLGLGDLGANGMPISVGKLSLYVAAGGIKPSAVLPVVLDVGTENKSLRDQPLYLGTPTPRLIGKEYYDFLDEWIHAVFARWPNAIVQFEDFKNPHAYDLLKKYRNQFRCFNDDIQSTGAVALAGLLSSLGARGLSYDNLAKEKIVCVGAGSAGIGVCDTIAAGMVAEGAVRTLEEAHSRFYVLDNNGLLGQGRDPKTLTTAQAPYVRKDMSSGQLLLDVINQVRPTALLGLTGTGGLFTEDVVRAMASHVHQPVIFPLSNPTSNSECTAENAFKWTEGRALFASGSPFDDVELKGQIYKSSQCNNYYIFPGVGLGIVTCGARFVPDSFFQAAARVIADDKPFEKDQRLFPDVQRVREIALDIAVKVCETAERENLSTKTPPLGMSCREFVQSKMWDPTWYQRTVLQ